MGLTLSELRKREARIPTFVQQFLDGEEFVFSDNSTSVIDKIKFGRDEFFPTDVYAEELIYELQTTNIPAGSIKVILPRRGRIPRQERALGDLAKTPEYGGQFQIATTGQSLSTETYSEVLSQYCLAYRIIHNRDLTRRLFIDPNNGGLNQATYRSIQHKIVSPPDALLSNPDIQRNLADFGTRPMAVGQFIWLDNGNAQARILMQRLPTISNDAVIYNDKAFAYNSRISPGTDNPYQIFARTAIAAKPDKWNPADMWVMTATGRRDLERFNTRIASTSKATNVSAINNFLQKKYDDADILPISLKKLNPNSPHFVLVNSRYFVEQIDLSSQINPPVIEFTTGNQDVKINFTLRTVELPRNAQPIKNQRNIQNLNGSVVSGSEKEVMIKYNVNKEQLEVFFQQTGGVKYSEARMGSIGKDLLTDIISGTSQQGVSSLNNIKDTILNEENNNLNLEKNNTFFISQRVIFNESNRATALRYLREIWVDINNGLDNNPSESEVPASWITKFGNNDGAIKKKIVSGEIGVSIKDIPDQRIRTRVIQNLYNAAGSIGVMRGLNQEEESIMAASGFAGTTNRLTETFMGGIHAKVY